MFVTAILNDNIYTDIHEGRVRTTFQNVTIWIFNRIRWEMSMAFQCHFNSFLVILINRQAHRTQLHWFLERHWIFLWTRKWKACQGRHWGWKTVKNVRRLFSQMTCYDIMKCTVLLGIYSMLPRVFVRPFAKLCNE